MMKEIEFSFGYLMYDGQETKFKESKGSTSPSRSMQHPLQIFVLSRCKFADIILCQIVPSFTVMQDRWEKNNLVEQDQAEKSIFSKLCIIAKGHRIDGADGGFTSSVLNQVFVISLPIEDVTEIFCFIDNCDQLFVDVL